MDNENIKNYCHISRHKILFSLLLIVLIIFVGAKAKNEISNDGKSVMNTSQSVITVSGEGKVFAKPDIGEITISVSTEKKTVSEAQKQNTESINKIFSFLKSAGIEEKDIKTTEYNIYPQYNYYEGKQTFRGYEIRQSFRVKIRDLEKTGEIIAGTTESGANIVGGLNFTIDDQESLKAEARKQAIDKAKIKAEKLAKDLGVKLSDLISFNENSGDYYPLYRETSSAVLYGKGGGDINPEVPTGENEITVNVNLTYKIK